MAFTLRWKNENPAGSVVKIYRGTAALNPASLPAPSATLSNGEESWVDTTVLLNTGYYYLLTVTVGERTVAGPQKFITIKNRRGVGKVDLINWGESDMLANLGDMDFAERFTYNAFPAGFRALTGLSGDAAQSLTKYLHQGRVLYMFSYGARFQAKVFSWDAIYNAGLVYGVDGFGPDDGRGVLSGVDQGGLFDWQGDTYRMRLMRGLSDVGEPTVMNLPASLNNALHGATGLGVCEYNELIYPWCEWMPAQQRIANWGNNGPSSLFSYNATWNGAGYLCQERDPVTNKVVMRGSAPATNVSVRDDLERIALVDPSVNSGYFMPVIELME
ncbi:putative virion structural protein [Erwinia phage vB_EamM_Phobos]|uniref:putative virion structural protein n=1 Tax=Erwinia phage vB_EamM_Phobos TaxID=1883377 RepID=UPI00081C30BF|nr:putative virion structural protein [Erwinia phage vB_EamM_Phobos]ANZ50340.1 putative virion structural protein [Erwinia phage vB_EamM_Phobos]